MKPAPLTPVAAAIRRKGYKLDARPLVPNLFGIRSHAVRLHAPGLLDEDPIDPFASITNRWDDYIGVTYFDGVLWREFMFVGTTDPGNLAGPDQRGTAVMKPGQYVDAYALGKHRGYPAIVNWGLTAPEYWRVNRTALHGVHASGEGNEYIGLNIHRANRDGDNPPTDVGPYSAGCQVIKDYDDWTWFLDKVTALQNYAEHTHARDYMTYTLLMLGDVTEVPEPQGHQLRGDGTISLIPEEDE